jgi:alpha-galactosidase
VPGPVRLQGTSKPVHGEGASAARGFEISSPERGAGVGAGAVGLSWRGRRFLVPDCPSALFRVRSGERWAEPLLGAGGVAWERRPDRGQGWSELTLDAPVGATGLFGGVVLRSYACAPVLEHRLVVRNEGTTAVRVEGIDTLAISLRCAAGSSVEGFRSAWGEEFAPFCESLDGVRVVETVTGRSSHGYHPYLSIGSPRDGEDRLVVAVMWSGNWIVRMLRRDPQTVEVTAGLSDREFSYELAPGEQLRAPSVAVSVEPRATGDEAAPLATVGSRHWYPPRPGGRPLPTAWNHWFPYTDSQISEHVFLQNLDVAAATGLESCTLDAGWFGPPEPGSSWTAWRGDWNVVNRARFPRGIGVLGEQCRSRGLGFGLWCEIEGVGERATLDGKRDRLEARRGDRPLGYLCFGCPDSRRFALDAIERLVGETGSTWLKLDCNVDPGLGCDRADHGHGAGSGLFEHVQSYYSFLDEVRERHPGVVLENCASGGLRVDLGVLSHLHVTYLSDLDWADHSLQVFWGASAMLHPRACLTFSNSEWGGAHAPRAAALHQDYDAADTNTPIEESATYLRLAMLHNFAVSLRLPELAGGVRRELGRHVEVYKQHVRPFVEGGDLLRLTPQPLRRGGERLPAFQYRSRSEDRHLVFAFRLDGDTARRSVRLAAVRPGRRYRVWSPFQGEVDEQVRDGEELTTEGLDLSSLRPRRSLVVLVDPAPA